METINTINPTFATIVMPQLISIQDVIKCTGLSRATIYRMIDEKSDHYDPTFPKRYSCHKCVLLGWRAKWQNGLIKKSLVGLHEAKHK